MIAAIRPRHERLAMIRSLRRLFIALAALAGFSLPAAANNFGPDYTAQGRSGSVSGNDTCTLGTTGVL